MWQYVRLAGRRCWVQNRSGAQIVLAFPESMWSVYLTFALLFWFLKKNGWVSNLAFSKLFCVVGHITSLQCTGKPYLLKAQHSAFNIVDSKTIPLTVQKWQITSFVPDSTDLVLDSSNICLAVRTVGMQRCPGFHKNVSFPK